MIDPGEGRILTSAHVITGVDGITVVFADGRELPAELIGSDACGGAAVIDLRERHARAFEPEIQLR